MFLKLRIEIESGGKPIHLPEKMGTHGFEMDESKEILTDEGIFFQQVDKFPSERIGSRNIYIKGYLISLQMI